MTASINTTDLLKICTTCVEAYVREKALAVKPVPRQFIRARRENAATLIREYVTANPHIGVADLKYRLGLHGIYVCTSTISQMKSCQLNALRAATRLGWAPVSKPAPRNARQGELFQLV